MSYPETKTKPYAHQVHAVTEASKWAGYLIAHDMGTGKTKTAVDLLTAVDARRVLILCPKSVISVWPDEIRKHSALDWEIIPLSGDSVAKKAAALSGIADMDRVVVIVNYEAAWRSPLGPVRNEKRRVVDLGLLASIKWDVAIPDEVHRIKAPGGKASWFCKLLRDKAAKRVYGLTGTPMPHSPLDIYGIMRAINPYVFQRSYTLFKSTYAVMGGFQGKQVLGFQNMEDLHRRLYTRCHRVMARDVLDLPPATHERRTVALGTKARKIYDQMETELVAELDTGVLTADNAMVKILRLQQVTGGTVPTDDGRFEVVGHEKEDLLADILEDVPADEPVVVFCLFRPDLDAVHRVAAKLKTSSLELSGRRNELAAWQSGGAQVLAVQIRAGGVGVNLVRARICCYYSVGHSLGDFEQSLARPMRQGQTRPVTYYHLVAKNTIDVRVYQALRDHKKIVDFVLEGMKGASR